MKIKNLSKTYATKTGEKVHALKNISFDLPSSGMVVILGKSGCGKSTLLNILGGLDRFDSGDVECFGKSLKSLSRKELDDYRNSCVGFVFQEYNLIPELDVFDNIALPLQLQGQTDNDEKVKSVLEQVGMSGFERRKVEELSGGQKQRVAIARALVKDPRIILADEPTGALDSHSGENILKILKWISQEKLVVLVTHDREFAEKYGDRIIELSDGVVIKDSKETYCSAESKQTQAFTSSHMPLKTAFKIGCGNFKYHRIRLFWTIFMSVIAFSLLAISMSVALLDPTDVFCQAIQREDIEFTAIYKDYWYEPEGVIDQSLDQFLGADNRRKEQVPMTKADIAQLESQLGSSFTMVYTAVVHSFQGSLGATFEQIIEARKQNTEVCYCDNADGYIFMTEEDCKALGYTVIGRLPQNTDEVAINECIFNIFTIGGLIEDNQRFDINSYEDIIGHKLSIVNNTNIDSFKTVTGVVVTGCNRACFESHNKPEERPNQRNWETHHEKIFVCQDYFEEYTYALYTVPQDKTELKKMVSFILEYEENSHAYRLENKLSEGFYDSIEVASLFKTLCLYLCILFLCFAMLLLSKYIITSMQRQMKQIGILTALGAGFKDLCKIYGSAIVAMCGVIAGITLVAQFLCLSWFNSFLRSYVRYLQFNLVPFSLPATLLLVLIVAVVAAAGCLVPIARLRKLDPTTIINRGQIK